MSIDRDLEDKIRRASFSNVNHKDSLKAKLFNSSTELSIDDLMGVSGGVGMELDPYIDEKWDQWPQWPIPEQATSMKIYKK